MTSRLSDVRTEALAQPLAQLLAQPRPAAVLRYSSLAPYDTEVVEVALTALPERHPARPLLLARLATAGG